MPTDSGYRYFVDRLLPARARCRSSCSSSGARSTRRCGATTEALSQVTNLLAIVSRPADRDRDDPPRRGAAAAAAGADGRRHHLDRRRDQAHVHVRRAGRLRPGGLGRRVPQRGADRRRPRSPHPRAPAQRAVARRPRARVPRRAVARVRRPRRDRRVDALHGRRRAAARPSTACRTSRQINSLMGMLEQRVTLLGGAAPPRWRPRTCSCASAPRTSCRSCARSRSSPSGYGLPARRLGAVSVLGPVRMDYGMADLQRARGGAPTSPASSPTSTTTDAPRPLRGARRRPRRRRHARSRRPSASSRASCIRTSTRPRPPRRTSRRRPRPTRSSATPSAARPSTATAGRGCAAAATRRRTSPGFGSLGDIFDAFFGGGMAGGRGGPIQGGDVAVTVEIDLLTASRRGEGRRRLRRDHALRALPRQRRRAGHADRDLRALRRRGPAAGRHAHALRPGHAHRRVRRLRRRRPRRQGAVQDVPGPRAPGRSGAR